MARAAIENSRALILAFLALLCVASCGTAANKPKPASAVLYVLCEVEDAEVWLDSRYLRSVAELKRGVRLRPGHYRVEVRRSSYHSMYYEISLEAGEKHTLRAELVPNL
jgi:hypothetical protein